MTRLKGMTLPAAVLALLTLLGLSTTVNVSGQSEPPPLPGGHWTFTAGPYSGPGHETAPVDVYSVTTNAEKGLTVTAVALNNKSGRDVVAVRLHWSLLDADKRTVLFEGDTSSVGVAIDAGKQRVLHYPVASFARIARSQMKRSALSGNYRLEVSVSDVTYADDSAGLERRAPKVEFRRAAYTQISRCQNQGCVYVAVEGTNSYVCQAHADTFCSVSNNGRSCTETRCDGGSLPPSDES